MYVYSPTPSQIVAESLLMMRLFGTWQGTMGNAPWYDEREEELALKLTQGHNHLLSEDLDTIVKQTKCNGETVATLIALLGNHHQALKVLQNELDQARHPLRQLDLLVSKLAICMNAPVVERRSIQSVHESISSFTYNDSNERSHRVPRYVPKEASLSRFAQLTAATGFESLPSNGTVEILRDTSASGRFLFKVSSHNLMVPAIWSDLYFCATSFLKCRRGILSVPGKPVGGGEMHLRFNISWDNQSLELPLACIHSAELGEFSEKDYHDLVQEFRRFSAENGF